MGCRRWIIVSCALLVLAYVVVRALSGPIYVPVRPSSLSRPSTVVVLVSGDAGFKVGMGPRLAKRFARSGIPVIGVDSLAAFVRHHTPQEASLLVETAAHKALAKEPNASLVLIGQSFGADLIPTALLHFPSDLRARLSLVALIVPMRSVYYRISPAEYFEFGTPDADAAAIARSITWVPMLCIRGAAEKSSLCSLLQGMPNVEEVTLPGGHPLERNADLVFGVLKHAMRKMQRFK